MDGRGWAPPPLKGVSLSQGQEAGHGGGRCKQHFLFPVTGSSAGKACDPGGWVGAGTSFPGWVGGSEEALLEVGGLQKGPG